MTKNAKLKISNVDSIVGYWENKYPKVETHDVSVTLNYKIWNETTRLYEEGNISGLKYAMPKNMSWEEKYTSFYLLPFTLNWVGT